MRSLQEILWLELEAEANNQHSVTFIVGSPRSGSTFCYQIQCQDNPAFFSNVCNDYFPEAPVVGLYLQAFRGRQKIKEVSRFGHTVGIWQPSEASRIFAHWFGDEQPGAIKAKDFLDVHQELHFLRTMDCFVKLFNRASVIKNAWNCFRLPLLHRLLPNAKYIWTRRDIAAAAKSDLHARYVTKGDPRTFNACHPSNVDDLSQLPFWEQVVENQAEYNETIKAGLDGIAPAQITIWQFENFVSKEPSWDLPDLDMHAIDKYADRERFLSWRHG